MAGGRRGKRLFYPAEDHPVTFSSEPRGCALPRPTGLWRLCRCIYGILNRNRPHLSVGFNRWGAYRELNQSPRSRSCAALFLTLLFSLAVAAGFFVAGWLRKKQTTSPN